MSATAGRLRRSRRRRVRSEMARDTGIKGLLLSPGVRVDRAPRAGAEHLPHPRQRLGERPRTVVQTFKLENYREGINSEVVRTLFSRTFVMSLLAAGIATAIAYPAAYIVVRKLGPLQARRRPAHPRAALGELPDAGVRVEDHPRRARDPERLPHHHGPTRRALGHVPVLADHRGPDR